MLTSTRDRIAAATGALFVVLVMVGNQIGVGGTDQSAHPSGAAVLRDAAHQATSASATVGFVLELLGFVALFGFLGYVLESGRRAGGRGGLAAGTAFASGLTMLIIKLGSVASMGALMLDRSSISPELARVLSDMNGVGFVLAWLPYALFVGVGALALHQSGLVGRPTAIIGAVVGIAGIVLALVSLRNPLDGNPMAWMAGLLWTLVVSVRLAVRPGSAGQRAAEQALERSPARMTATV